MSSFPLQLTQAQAAAQAANWPQVIHDLQRLVFGNSQNLAVDLQTLPVFDRQSWLDLGLQVLEWGDFQERWDVAKILPHFGTEAIEALLEILVDEEAQPDAQWFAVRILGDANHPAIVPALLQIIQQAAATSQPAEFSQFESSELQMVAANALTQIGPSVLTEIEPLLSHPQTKRIGTKILSQIRHSETVMYLLNLAKDEDAQVRSIAVEALGSFHAPEIAHILQISLRDYATPVRSAAIAALSFCFNDLPKVDWVREITPLLSDLNLDVCRQAAAVLGKVGSAAAIAQLMTTLRSNNLPEPLAISIVRAIGQMDQISAIKQLALAWQEYPLSTPVRLELCRVLSQLEQPDSKSIATELLLQWLEHDDTVAKQPALRQVAILALGQLGQDRAIEPLVQHLADADPRVRLHVVAALKALAIDQAEGILQHWQSSCPPNSQLRQGIEMALQEW